MSAFLPLPAPASPGAFLLLSTTRGANNRSMKPLALIVALVAFSTSAFAQGGYKHVDELRLVRSVLVYVIEDQVTDGCLSNPNALKVEAELILRRSGISVTATDLDPHHYKLGIMPVGWERKREGGQSLGSCSVQMHLEMWRFAKVPEGHEALTTAYETAVLLVGNKDGMQERLRTEVSEIVSNLANEILKARGQ
jgi:hypothetical protein